MRCDGTGPEAGVDAEDKAVWGGRADWARVVGSNRLSCAATWAPAAAAGTGNGLTEANDKAPSKPTANWRLTRAPSVCFLLMVRSREEDSTLWRGPRQWDSAR